MTTLSNRVRAMRWGEQVLGTLFNRKWREEKMNPDVCELRYYTRTHKLLSIITRLRIWTRRAIRMVENDRLYRPGGVGYLQAREDFQVRAGQRRATRRYRPY